jgi:hypothetical protein
MQINFLVLASSALIQAKRLEIQVKEKIKSEANQKVAAGKSESKKKK